MVRQVLATLLAALLAASVVSAQIDSTTTATPPPPGRETEAAAVRAGDAPNDSGDSALIEWTAAPAEAEPAGPYRVTAYVVLRQQAVGEPAVWSFGDPFPPAGWTVSATLPRLTTSYRDSGLEKNRPYRYAVASMQATTPLSVVTIQQPAVPTVQWFHSAKGFLLLNLLVLSGAIIGSVVMAARGHVFYIRKIAGLDAVEEAVGRATEMGRPVLFVPGIQDMDNVQTVAGITILGSMAQLIAQYEAPLEVPVARSLVMSTARETVKEAYTAAGRPDLYNDDIVHYVTDEQFGYVAAVDGYMVRERPAACFYMGAFFAESLILAETGNSIGAIQIAGTAQPTQLPFFVAACDYTLIGEELFAASAYLSKNPGLLGSLRGQDIGKALAMVAILTGATVETIGRLGPWGSPFLAFSEFMRRFFATNF